MYSRTRGRSAGRRGYSRSSDRLHAPLGQLPVAWGANRFVRISPIRAMSEEAFTTRPSALSRARFGLLLPSCGFPASTARRGIRRLELDSEARPLAHGVDELWPTAQLAPAQHPTTEEAYDLTFVAALLFHFVFLALGSFPTFAEYMSQGQTTQLTAAQA